MAERFLERRRLGDQWVALEELAEAATLSAAEAFACFQQSVAGAVELGAPADMLAAAARALGTVSSGTVKWRSIGIERCRLRWTMGSTLGDGRACRERDSRRWTGSLEELAAVCAVECGGRKEDPTPSGVGSS